MYTLVYTVSRCTPPIMAFPSKTDGPAIIAAAIELLERDGEAALTLRRVSGLLGVTPNALYRYYSSRDILVAAVANEVARRLLDAINLALAGLEGASEANRAGRVRILMNVYADFADTHPTLYLTLTTAKATAAAELPVPLYTDLLWLKVIEILEPLTGEANAPAAGVTLWSLLHGLWALKQANRLGGKKPEDINDFALGVLLKGLGV